MFMITICFLNCLFFISADQAQAAEDDPRDFKLKIPIDTTSSLGNIETVTCSDGSGELCYAIPWIAKYFQLVYRYAVILGSLIAVIMIMVGGFMYMTGGLNQNMLQKGKEFITGAVLGLILLLGSYTVLYFINPNLVQLRAIETTVVKKEVIPPEYCEDVDKEPYSEYFKLGDKVGHNHSKENAVCGDKFQIKIKTEQQDKIQGIATDTTCVYSKCSDQKKFCAAQGEGYVCKDAYVFGNITLATKVSLGTFASGQAVQHYTLKYIELREADTDYISRDNEVGKGILQRDKYAIQKGFGVEPTAMNYLETEVSDPGAFGEQYYIDARGLPIAIDTSWGSSGCETYRCVPNQQKIQVTPGCAWIMKSDLDQGLVQVDIDLNNFVCSGKPLKECRGENGLEYETEKDLD